MSNQLKYTNRENGLSFMGIPFHNQTCPHCETTYQYLALGKDLRRDNMGCPQCVEPELFVEPDPDESLLALREEILDE